MKLSILILFFGLLQTSAKTFSQVTLNEKGTSLEKVLQNIERQTDYTFIYDENKVGDITINVKVVKVPVAKALDACFRNLRLSYSIVGKNIILKPGSLNIVDRVKSFFKLPVIVKGVVTDSAGTPLNLATVFFIEKIKRQQDKDSGEGPQRAVETGTYVTNSDGTFYMEADEGDVLGVSFVGFETYTFRVKRDLPFQRIVLRSARALLKEVVVQTGYQTLSKERATGSFSKPNMKVFAERSSTMDVIGRLEGQIPGLTVSRDVAIDPTTRARTQRAFIRGLGSIQLPTEPLYVVNGVIVKDFSAVNVDNIEDITVLKDAAAAAIWGAQAANGVIVVVTKTGSRNQKIRFGYQGFANFQGKPNLDYQKNLSSRQYINAARETFDPVTNPYRSLYSSFVAPHEQILYDQKRGMISEVQANASLDSLAGIDNKQQIKDLWFRNAFTTNHTISASGGSNVYSFYSTLGYTNVRSVTPGEKNNTYRIDLNQTYTPNRSLSLSLNTSLANNVTSGLRPISIGADALPYQLFRDPNGNAVSMPYIYGMSAEQQAQYQGLSGIDLGTYLPLEEINYGHSKSNNKSFNVVGNATLKIIKGLSYLGTYGFQTSPGMRSDYDDHRKYSLRDRLVSFTVPGNGGSAPTYLIPATGGNFTSVSTDQRNWTIRNQLAYNLNTNSGNNVLTLQGGQEARESLSYSATTNVLGYDENLQTSPLVDYYSLSKGVPGTVTGYGYMTAQPFLSQEVISRFHSYFALASYTHSQKYSLDASWRVDHSNLFGNDVSAQNKPVYSFGGKWQLGREKFMERFQWLENLALRGTFGITGNSPFAGSATIFDVLSDPSTNYMSFPLIAGKEYKIDTKANSKLSWESTKTTNLGLDFGLFENRLTGTMEYYFKSTTSLLGNMALDPFAGQNSGLSNIGKLNNQGLNLAFNTVNLRTRNFTWSSGIVFAINKNKLVDYTPPQEYQNSPSYLISAAYLIGKPVNPLFAYKYAGLDAVGDPQVKLADGTITKDPEAPKGSDMVYMGSVVPKANGGISNTFRYKQIQLNANIVGSFGAVMRRDVNSIYSGRITGNSGNLGGNLHADFMNRWKNPGDENITNIPAYNPDNYYDYSVRNVNFYTKSDINVVSASYLKMRDVSLSYDLGKEAIKWLRIQGATIRLQVSNILLWTANGDGIDPEYHDFIDGNRQLPFGQHSIIVAANINF